MIIAAVIMVSKFAEAAAPKRDDLLLDREIASRSKEG